MQYARAQNILSGQTNLARRVFSAVPMQEYWSVGQISNEMHRKEPHNLSKAEISGCLRTLVDAGLVSEAGLLTFKSTVKPEKEVAVTAPNLKKKPEVKVSLMDQLFGLATDMRDMAEKIDAIALEVDTAILEAGKGDEKLKALQATLRGLMGEG